MTLSASLNENTVNLFEDQYYDSGAIHVEGATIHCWKHEGHGAQSILNVVENSCNPGFVYLGQKLGKEKLMKYIIDFGFGSKTNIDLNGEASGILFSLDKMGPVELATTSFGQGISVTPIQQVRAVSAAINGGNLYQPYLLKSIVEPETGSEIVKKEPVLKRKVIEEDTSKMVRFALESVVAHGSGRNAYIESYRVGGKTGTAQKVENGHYLSGNYILSFIGFMPADDPEIVVYVALDHPLNAVQYGGTVAAPIAKAILESAIPILGIEPRQDGMEKEYLYYDTKYVKIPNVIGLKMEEARAILKSFRVQYSGVGERILYQSPLEGEYIKEFGTIQLFLG